MKKHTLTSKSTTRSNPKKDDEYVQFFKLVIFAELCLIALLSEKKIFFVDQCHVQKSYHVRGYSKKGKRAISSHSTSLTHSAYSFMTIIGIDGSCYMVCIEGYFTAERVMQELNKFLRLHKGEDMMIFFDNHAMHWSYEMFE